MTLEQLIAHLENIQRLFGPTCPVVVLDGEGEWPFSVHVEKPMMPGQHDSLICLDITGEPETVTLEAQPTAP